jgi:hypothetical protein
MTTPSYLHTIARLFEAGAIPRGHVVHVDVQHDRECALLNGLTTCNCEPLVMVRRNAA